MSQQKIMAYWMKKRRTEPLKKGGGRLGGRATEIPREKS